MNTLVCTHSPTAHARTRVHKSAHTHSLLLRLYTTPIKRYQISSNANKTAFSANPHTTIQLSDAISHYLTLSHIISHYLTLSHLSANGSLSSLSILSWQAKQWQTILYPNQIKPTFISRGESYQHNARKWILAANLREFVLLICYDLMEKRCLCRQWCKRWLLVLINLLFAYHQISQLCLCCVVTGRNSIGDWSDRWPSYIQSRHFVTYAPEVTSLISGGQ